MYKLPENIHQAFINYLASRPYAEVYQLISALSKLEKVEEIKEEKKK